MFHVMSIQFIPWLHQIRLGRYSTTVFWPFFPLSMLEKVECVSDCKTYHPLLLMWIFGRFYCRSMNYKEMRILLYMNCWVHIIVNYQDKSCELSKEGVGNAQHIKCLAKWDTVCLPKKNGGLGVLNLRVQNQALIIKFLFKFYNMKDTPWV
jgi:hypothetical protein